MLSETITANLDVFAKLRKATIRFVMSVCLHLELGSH